MPPQQPAPVASAAAPAMAARPRVAPGAGSTGPNGIPKIPLAEIGKEATPEGTVGAIYGTLQPPLSMEDRIKQPHAMITPRGQATALRRTSPTPPENNLTAF